MQDLPTQGSIGDVFLPRLVAGLHLDEFEGALRITFPDATKVLYFKRGEIASAASNAEADRLANILSHEGRLDPEQLDLARKHLQPGASLGKTLIDMGFLTPSELLQGARRQVRLIVVSCFQASTGTYEMAPGPLPAEVTSLGLNTKRLLFDCAQEAGDRAVVIREIGSMESVYRPTERLALALSSLRLDFETDRIARMLDGSATLRDISSRTSLDDFTVGKVILALDLLGAAEKVTPVAETPARAPAEATAPPGTAEIPSPAAGEAPVAVAVMAAAAPPAEEPPPVPPDELPAFARPLSEAPAEQEPHWQVDPETGERVHAGPIEMTFDGQIAARRGEARGLTRILLAAGAVTIVAAAVFAYAILRRGASGPQPPEAAAPELTATGEPADAHAPGETAAEIPPAAPEPPPIEPAAQEPTAAPEPAAAPATGGLDLSGDPAYVAALQRLDQGDAPGAALLFKDLIGSQPGGSVTLQLMIACQEDTVKGARRRAGASGSLFILPYSLKGRPCYRVLWGLYENGDAARGDVPSLPPALTQGTEPVAVSLARLRSPG